jgi:hypothetical protein
MKICSKNPRVEVPAAGVVIGHRTGPSAATAEKRQGER